MAFAFDYSELSRAPLKSSTGGTEMDMAHGMSFAQFIAKVFQGGAERRAGWYRFCKIGSSLRNNGLDRPVA